MYGHRWVNCSGGFVPPTAVIAGHDKDGAMIYVGRCEHEGQMMPAKVIPARNVAYVSFNYSEIEKDNYELLVPPTFDWIKSSDVPFNAVSTGEHVNGEPVYVGRVRFDEGFYSVGKIIASQMKCFVPFDGKEEAHDEYEVLVMH